MTHAELCARAVQWLRGTRRCYPVLSGIASAGEVPDAIGWSSKWSHAGSILVECKMSLSDFHRDKRKKHKLRIGRWRYFLCPVNVLTRISVELHYPDHGLLYLDHGRVYVIREAPQREDCNLDSEIRLLRFALVHLEGNLLQMGFSVNLPTLTKRLGIAGLAPSDWRRLNRFGLQVLELPEKET